MTYRYYVVASAIEQHTVDGRQVP